MNFQATDETEDSLAFNSLRVPCRTQILAWRGHDARRAMPPIAVPIPIERSRPIRMARYWATGAKVRLKGFLYCRAIAV